MVIKLEQETHLVNIMEKKRRKLFGDGGDYSVEGGKMTKRVKGGGGQEDGESSSFSEGVMIGGASSSLLEGMSAAEVTMIRRLAGNDPIVRKKTMRKLRKWLSTLVLRFPDDLDSRSEVEPTIIRVWKALFYCMWMADKPLPQEQLAEQISNLVAIVGIKANILVIFVEWFFRTIAREWNWIDRFRLDKFMMLFRRFLRKTFLTMASRKWSGDMVNGFLSIIRIFVFNHHPTTSTKFKKGGVPSAEPIAKCPMGLQLHFIDIFLEELAKTGGDELKPKKVMKFLSPFIEEMATNTDDRVLNALTERIFHHLMKQSDVGIDYQESLMGIDDDSEEDEDDLNGNGENGEADSDDNINKPGDEDDAMGEDDVFNVDDGPLDPRAGAVDVILPQLQLDYDILAEKLTDAGGSKIVKKRNRGKLYALASSFKDLVNGNYPLALPEKTSWKPAIPKQELEKATMRLLQLEVDESAETKVRKTKKQRRRDARKLQQHEQLDDTMGSEDSSVFLNDTGFLDQIDDNYSSYVNEQMNSTSYDHGNGDTIDNKLRKRKKDNQKSGVHGAPYLAEGMNEEPKIKKKKKYPTVVEFESDQLNEDEELSVSVVEQKTKSKKQSRSFDQDTVINILPKKKRKSLTLGSGKVLTSSDGGQSKRHKCPSLSPCNTDVGLALSRKSSSYVCGTTPSPPLLTPIKGNDILRRKLKLGGTPASEGCKRRINFALTKNLEHDATDYMPSISKSPAIPFDASKTPTSGILKSKLNRRVSGGLTPVGRKSVGGVKTSPRKKALEFF